MIFHFRMKKQKLKEEKWEKWPNWDKVYFALLCFALCFKLLLWFWTKTVQYEWTVKRKSELFLRFAVKLLFNSNSSTKSVKNSNEKRMSQLKSTSTSLTLVDSETIPLIMRPSGLIIAVIPFLPVSCTSSFRFPRWSNSQSKPHLLHQTVFCLKIVPLHSLSCNWFFLLK